MKSKFLKSITTISIVASLFATVITGQAVAEVDKSQPIHVMSPWNTTGGTHAIGEFIVDYLEDQGWTDINNGNGFQSTGGCANLINQRTKTTEPVFWIQANPVLGQPKGHPCYVDEVKADEFVVPFYGWTDFICRRSDLDLPPLDEATGTVRIAVDLPERFGEVEKDILRAMAPNATVIPMHYSGSPGALKAIQAKEVDYAWSTLFEERSEGRLTCDYNTSTKSFRGTTSIRTAFPDIDVEKGRWLSFKGASWGWFNASNADEDLKAAWAKDFTDAFVKDESTKSLMNQRGYIPPGNLSEVTNKVVKNIVGEKWTGNFDGYEK